MSIIGIDLGTTNSLVAVMGEDGPRTLPNELGDHLTPSAVAVAADGALLVGRAARDRLVVAPAVGWMFFKRDMGTDERRIFGGREWTPQACSAAILKELKRVAELHLQTEVTRAVITVPAYFHDSQRLATLTAAEIAGLHVERVLNEPTAAALAYGYANPEAERQLLVFDLGGGTFDVTLLEVFDNVVEVKASSGDSRLGGEDYTDALLDLVAARLGVRDAAARARLRQELEVCKRRLTTEEEIAIEIAGKAVRVTRADLARVGRDLTARLRPIVRRCLRDGRVARDDLHDVLLVGGASRMALVDEFIADEFGSAPSRVLDPDRVVALGAAVQGAAAERHEAVRDLILTDVCPHSLGVEVTKAFGDGSRFDSGYFQPIIDRNVTVPVSRIELFHTLDPRQDAIMLRVFQGESRRVEGNTLLGEFEVHGLRHRSGQKRPGEITVRFSYDMNGILEVEATTLHSGDVVQKVIEGRPGSMSKEEVADAVRRLKPLKVRPRDLLPNRARLERAHRLFAELTGAPRRELGECIDMFEDALERDDTQALRYQMALLDDVLRRYYELEGESRGGEEP